jgi:hypothetical protein
MNFYASSVALLWTTAMKLRSPRIERRAAQVCERAAGSRRPFCRAIQLSADAAGRGHGAGIACGCDLTCKCE